MNLNAFIFFLLAVLLLAGGSEAISDPGARNDSEASTGPIERRLCEDAGKICCTAGCNGTSYILYRCPAGQTCCDACASPCGNGVCDSGETCSSCPADCGSCSAVNCTQNINTTATRNDTVVTRIDIYAKPSSQAQWPAQPTKTCLSIENCATPKVCNVNGSYDVKIVVQHNVAPYEGTTQTCAAINNPKETVINNAYGCITCSGSQITRECRPYSINVRSSFLRKLMQNVLYVYSSFSSMSMGQSGTVDVTYNGTHFLSCQLSTTDVACCPKPNMCVFNGICYDIGFIGDIDNDGIAEKCTMG